MEAETGAMLCVDPWHWMEPDGSLPPDHPQLWPKVMQLAQAIQTGWDLPPRSARQTLLLCSKRPQRKRCPGQLWVSRLPDDALLVFCAECGTEQIYIQNWQSTPWAGPRPAPRSLEPPPKAQPPESLSLDRLADALTENLEDWVSYYDLDTGEVLTVPFEDEFDEDDLDGDFDEQARLINEDQTGRYVAIEPLESHESFAIMESFVVGLPDSRMRSQLEQALRGRKPFRRFKDELSADSAVRESWFAFERETLRELAARWLEDARAGRDLATAPTRSTSG